jgi:alkylation response protein AidB-like acyl-CoA dehydrogenase
MDFTCFAEDKGDHYLVNGSKAWVTNAVAGTVFVIFMRTAKENGSKSFTNFLVEKGFSGFNVSERYRTVGFCASTTCDFRFKSMRVPVQNRLGEEGDGLAHIGRTIHWGQAYLAAIGVGIGEACLEQAARYAKERVISGRPIIKYQLIASKLADMFVEIEAARVLTHKVLWMIENESNPAMHSRAAKLAAGDACMRAAVEAMEIMGSAGYSDEYPVERYFRDAKFIAVGLGPAEIQRINLARAIEKRY